MMQATLQGLQSNWKTSICSIWPAMRAGALVSLEGALNTPQLYLAFAAAVIPDGGTDSMHGCYHVQP